MSDADLSTRVGDAANRDLFPIKLHGLIEATSVSDHADIIQWQPHGRAFKIFDRDRLVSQVLPHYLQRQKHSSSFQRQLNLYGFHKLTGDHSDHGAYYHELFLRGRPMLSTLIFRLEKGVSGVRRKFDVETEPNFRQMSLLPAVFTCRRQLTIATERPCHCCLQDTMLRTQTCSIDCLDSHLFHSSNPI
jgi:HSF-type DNA-binding